MAQPRVFISHSHKDNEFVRRFVKDLRDAGAIVWVDLDGIKEGDILKRTNEGLAQSDWCIPVLSTNSVPARSPNVEMEVNAALRMFTKRKLKGVIPFYFGTFDTGMLPPIWRGLKAYVESIDGYETALAGLLKAIGIPLQSSHRHSANSSRAVKLNPALLPPNVDRSTNRYKYLPTQPWRARYAPPAQPSSSYSPIPKYIPIFTPRYFRLALLLLGNLVLLALFGFIFIILTSELDNTPFSLIEILSPYWKLFLYTDQPFGLISQMILDTFIMLLVVFQGITLSISYEASIKFYNTFLIAFLFDLYYFTYSCLYFFIFFINKHLSGSLFMEIVAWILFGLIIVIIIPLALGFIGYTLFPVHYFVRKEFKFTYGIN